MAAFAASAILFLLINIGAKTLDANVFLEMLVNFFIWIILVSTLVMHIANVLAGYYLD